MDPNQNDPNSGNSNTNSDNYGAGSAPSISPWQQNNENQTPAYNNTDYWNSNSNTTASQETSSVTPEPEQITNTDSNQNSLNQESSSPLESPTTPQETTNDVPQMESTPTNSWDNTNNQDATPENTSQSGSSNPWITTSATEQSNPTPPQESAQSVNETSPVSKPPSSSNALMIGMIALVVILLGSTGLFAFQNYQLKQEMKGSSPTPSTSVSPTPTPSVDPTADWKVYTNTEQGITFKYPADLSFVYDNLGNVDKGQPSGNLLLQNYDGLKPLPSGNNPYQLALTVNKATSSTLEDFAKKSADPKNPQLEKTTINGLEAVKGKTVQKNQTVPTVWFSTGKYFYTAQLSTPASTYADWFEKIVSTFKKSEAPSSSPTSTIQCSTGFEKFTNANFSFCYPTGMTKTAASTDTSVVFENTTETLKVVQNFQGGWGGSECLSINAVEVAGYKSKRLSWKAEKTTGTGCETTFTSFATVINEGVFQSPFPYMVEYTKKTGTFTDDKNFIAIETSFTPEN